jgi:hypothetical protein
MLKIVSGIISGIVSELFKTKAAEPSPAASAEAKAPASVETKAPALQISIPAVSRPWKGIVFHHSFSKDNPTNSDFESIKRYHTSYRIDGNIVTKEVFEARKAAAQGSSFEKPWSDVGYHIILERVDGKLEWKWGRPWNVAGAHAGVPGNNHYNENYLGVCVIGNFDNAAPDGETWQACLALARQVMERFKISKDKILGHRETYAKLGLPQKKSCPGKMWDLEKMRADI